MPVKTRASSFVIVRPFVDSEARAIPPSSTYPREVLRWDGKDSLTLLDPQDDFAPRKNGTFKGMNVIWELERSHDSEKKLPVSSQSDVYERAVKPVIPTIVDGYNAAFLIAGGAGSGRTYALYGEDVDGPNRGILPRFAEEIFDAFDRLNHENSSLSTQMEVIDISGEHYMDMLAVKRHSNNKRGVEDEVKMKLQPGSEGPRLSGATEAEIKGASDLRSVLKQLMRSVGKRNTTHTVTFRFTETFEFEDPDNYGQSISQSRRIQVTFILLRSVPPAFQRCVDVAVEHDTGENPLAKVPIHETALTKLFPTVLQQEFNLTFLCCLSPYYENMRENLSTLQFASKVSRLVCFPQLNQDEELVDMRRLADEVKTLKTQVRSQSAAMEMVQKELNSREVELMKQEASYNEAARKIAKKNAQLKLATIGRNMEADRTRLFRKDMESQLRAKRREVQSVQSSKGTKDQTYAKVQREADDAKVRTETLENRIAKQKENTAVYQKRMDAYRQEEQAVKDMDDFNVASPEEQERILFAGSRTNLQAKEELRKAKEEEAAVRAADTSAQDKQAIQAEYDRVYAQAVPIHEKDTLLAEIAELEKEIADAEAESKRLQTDIDQKKAQCGCTVM